jgi:hypothetical protein
MVKQLSNTLASEASIETSFTPDNTIVIRVRNLLTIISLDPFW